jgi:hypothetical protein
MVNAAQRLFHLMALTLLVSRPGAAGELIVHGGRGAIVVRAPTAAELRLAGAALQHLHRKGTERGGGAALSELESFQVEYQAPVFGEPGPAGNAVLLQWFEDGNETAPVSVRLNGETICTVPALTAAGSNACVVSGLPRTCRPDFDPGCVPNLGSESQCRIPEGAVLNAHVFEIVLPSGESLRQCQEVADTWPFGSSVIFAYRTRAADTIATNLTGGRCDEAINLVASTTNCVFRSTANDTDIIITGNNGGPPPTFLNIHVDGVERLHIEEPAELFCFDHAVAIETRGVHEIRFEGYLSRPQASETFWFNPETNEFYGPIIGGFFGLNLTTSCVETTRGRPQPPSSLVLRQTSFAGEGIAVRASWVNAEAPYPGGVRVSIGGNVVQTLDGGVETALLGGLATGRRSIGVRGDGAAAGLSDETVGEILVRSQSPFPTSPPPIQCDFDLAGERTARLSWSPNDSILWVDVHRRRAGSVDFEIVASAVPGTSEVLVHDAARGDVLRAQFFRQQDTSLYAIGVADCAAPQDAGAQLPGDMNQDRQLNIADAVALLLVLFRSAEGVVIPCEGGIEEAGAGDLVDWDGNQEVNLTDSIALLRHLFLGDSRHVLGSSCIAIAGCPVVCVP